MRRIAVSFIIFLISGGWLVSAEAAIARGGGGMRPHVQNRSANISRANINTANINRANINRNVANVNRNVNVNRDIDVHGWHGGYWDDPGWGWGSFATGAAVGATTAAVGAAIADHDDTVVVTPPVAGTVVATLPPSCSMVTMGGPTTYNCGGVYYQPYYSGSNLVYHVVPGP
jgi:hypothetical protein